MLEQVHETIDRLRVLVGALDPAHPDAPRLLALFAEGEKLCASATTLLAGCVPTQDLARVTGVTEGQAKAVVEVAERLRELPTTEEAFRSGELSLAQAAAVADAASADPSAEDRLLEAARTSTVRQLRDTARRVKAAAEEDALGRYERQRRARSFRHGVDDEGMVWGHFRLPPDTGAAVVHTIQVQADREFRTAYREGRREPHHAYAADALVALVTGNGKGRGARAEVVVVVDHHALVRGHVEGDECCEIRGVGSVPVEVARAIMSDAFLKGVVVEGTEVRKVRHFGRHVPAEVRTALELRHGCCRAPGCDRTQGLEWDHVHEYAKGGATELANLQPLCPYHHRLKTAGRWPP